jgi:hypothetical protein
MGGSIIPDLNRVFGRAEGTPDEPIALDDAWDPRVGDIWLAGGRSRRGEKLSLADAAILLICGQRVEYECTWVETVPVAPDHGDARGYEYVLSAAESSLEHSLRVDVLQRLLIPSSHLRGCLGHVAEEVLSGLGAAIRAGAIPTERRGTQSWRPAAPPRRVELTPGVLWGLTAPRRQALTSPIRDDTPSEARPLRWTHELRLRSASTGRMPAASLFATFAAGTTNASAEVLVSGDVDGAIAAMVVRHSDGAVWLHLAGVPDRSVEASPVVALEFLDAHVIPMSWIAGEPGRLIADAVNGEVHVLVGRSTAPAAALREGLSALVVSQV